MGKRNEKGFTLIEVVVVVAVIAILAAVLTPYIIKYIDDSKIAKARNEAQVIGGAMTVFLKDTGQWPSRSATGTAVAVLYTGTRTPAIAAIFAAAVPPVVPPVALTWGTPVATLDNSLLVNGTGNAYPAIGDLRWAGPYVGSALPTDPWGNPYVVNVAVAGPIWVLSAGPNLRVQTRVIDNVVIGDDIGFRVR